MSAMYKLQVPEPYSYMLASYVLLQLSAAIADL